MKIFGAGYGRTGTTSLKVALKILGYKTIQFDTSFTDLLLNTSGTNLDLHKYKDIDAVTDHPTAPFYREFMEYFPDMKVILTHRNEQDWWESTLRHLTILPVNGPNDYSQGWKHPKISWHSRNVAFGLYYPHELLYKKRYREYNDQVRYYVPPNKLLELDFTSGDGWDKLCTFLGKPIPHIAFPHKNQSKKRSTITT